MRLTRPLLTATLLPLLLAGCESMPRGPGVAVMPATGKPLEVFRQDDIACQNYAFQVIGPAAGQEGNKAFAGTAALGAAVGAGVGAIAGGTRGAGTGAAFGLATGSLLGLGNAQYANRSLQERFDIAYQQCMVSKGNQLPPPRPAPVFIPGYYGGYGFGSPYGFHGPFSGFGINYSFGPRHFRHWR